MKLLDDIKKSLALNKCQKELNRLMGSFDNLVAHNVPKGDERYLVIATSIQEVVTRLIDEHNFTHTSVGIAYPKLDMVREYCYESHDEALALTKKYVLPGVIFVFGLWFVFTTYHAGMVDWFHFLTAPTRW